MRFDHAGLATEDAQKLADLFSALFDVDIAHEETFDGMDVLFLDFGNGYFEILEPLEGGAIDRYLQRNGPGIHHLAVETEDIQQALETAREREIKRIDDSPRAGAWGHDIAFLDPRDTGGILVEFVEH